MAKFVVRIYEIGAHDFTIDAPDEEAAVALARANFDAQVDAETYTSLGLAPGHPPVRRARDRGPERRRPS